MKSGFTNNLMDMLAVEAAEISSYYPSCKYLVGQLQNKIVPKKIQTSLFRFNK